MPFTFVDIGVDGLRGTADDKNLTLLGFPTANAAAFPVDQYVTNLDQFGRYKTIEVSTNKRYGNKWSAALGGGYTWQNNFIEGFPQNPNQPGAEDRTRGVSRRRALTTRRMAFVSRQSFVISLA